MRLLRIGTAYPKYWKQFYTKHHELSSKSYSEQLKALLLDSFGQSDAHSNAFTSLGYECQDIFANVEPLQMQWARENDFKWDESAFLKQQPLEMAKKFKPTVVFLNDFVTFDSKWVAELKDVCPSVRLVVGWCGVPVTSTEKLNGYDIVLTSAPILLEHFRRNGLRAELIHHAFDPRVLDRIDTNQPPSIDFSFIGGINRIPSMHLYRTELIEKLIREIDITLYCTGVEQKISKLFMRKIGYDTASLMKSIGFSDTFLARIPLLNHALKIQEVPKISLRNPIGRINRGGLFGLEMYQTLADSRLTLNVHIGGAGEYTGNMRLFEATGVGTCLLTDWKKDLNELFEIDTQVVAFKTPDECIEKAKWLLDNPEQCKQIAAAGHQRTLKDHTYKNRVEILDRLFQESL